MRSTDYFGVHWIKLGGLQKDSVARYFVKIIAVCFAMLACVAKAGGVSAQPAASVPTPGLPASQNNAPLPPNRSPFVPDSPEKQERVKKLVNQINATYGLDIGREIGAVFWGPRPGKLYALHKKLTDDDWKLLAEMYVSFYDSHWTLLAGLPFNDNFKKASRLDDAMQMLLAMHGEESSNILNTMVASAASQPAKYKKEWRGFETYNESWQWRIGRINMFAKDRPWRDTSEYKNDRQRSNK